MRSILICTLMFVSAVPASAKDLVYEGTWVTTNRKLDGPMTCVVSDLGDNKWHGHFFGVWEGIEFSYHVDFSGPTEKLRGEASIDGAFYEWTGKLETEASGRFTGKFSGDRYLGSFILKKKSR